MPRFLEVRRHSARAKPGQHLSREGVALARRVGQGLGPFALVVTSSKLRAVETAVAMGFAIDREIEELSELGKGVEEEVDWDAGFAAFARVLPRQGATAQFAARLAGLWAKLVEEVPEGGTVLVVTHGGIVEAGALGCLPTSPVAERGSCCGFCEGVRLTWEHGRWTAATFLDVPPP